MEMLATDPGDTKILALLSQECWHKLLVPALGRQRQEDFVSSNLAWSVVSGQPGLCVCLVSKQATLILFRFTGPQSSSSCQHKE